MGVDYTAYVGIGLKLATEKTYNDIIAKIDTATGYHYDVDFSDEHIELVVDGMGGQYIYLLYVLDSHDMYDETEGIELSLEDFRTLLAQATPALLEALKTLGLSDFTKDAFKFISFTHVW